MHAHGMLRGCNRVQRGLFFENENKNDNMIKEKRFLLLKTVGNDRLMYIASIAANNRIEAMEGFRKFTGENLRYGFGFWQYYVSGIRWVRKPYRKKVSVDSSAAKKGQAFVQLEMFE